MGQSRNKPSVMHVIDHWGLGGAQRALCTLVELDGERCHHVYSVFRHGSYPWEVNADVRFLARSYSGLLLSLWRLRRAVTQSAPDLIQVHLNGSRFVVFLALLWMGRKPPVVWHEHSGEELVQRFGVRLGTFLMRLQRFLARSVHGVIANSPHTAQYCIEKLSIDAQRITTLYCPINREEILRLAQCEPADVPGDACPSIPIVGFIGSLAPQKRPDDFIELAHRLTQRGVLAQFWVVGSGPLLKKMMNDVDRLELKGRIVFWGSRSEVFPIMRKMRVVVMPSVYETYGLVALEAMTLAKPVVGYDVGGLSRILRLSPLGHPVPKSDIEALESEVTKVLYTLPADSTDQTQVDENMMEGWKHFYLSLLGRVENEGETG